MIPPDLAKTVFGEIEMGLNAYVHRTTYEVIGLPTEQMMDYAEEEDWEPNLSKVENNADDYLLIEPLSTPEAIKVRQRFTWRVEDERLSDKLFNSLNGRGAFRRFRNILDNNPEVLEQWYAFERDYKQRHVESLVRLWLEEE